MQKEEWSIALKRAATFGVCCLLNSWIQDPCASVQNCRLFTSEALVNRSLNSIVPIHRAGRPFHLTLGTLLISAGLGAVLADPVILFGQSRERSPFSHNQIQLDLARLSDSLDRLELGGLAARRQAIDELYEELADFPFGGRLGAIRAFFSDSPLALMALSDTVQLAPADPERALKAAHLLSLASYPILTAALEKTFALYETACMDGADILMQPYGRLLDGVYQEEVDIRITARTGLTAARLLNIFLLDSRPVADVAIRWLQRAPLPQAEASLRLAQQQLDIFLRNSAHDPLETRLDAIKEALEALTFRPRRVMVHPNGARPTAA